MLQVQLQECIRAKENLTMWINYHTKELSAIKSSLTEAMSADNLSFNESKSIELYYRVEMLGWMVIKHESKLKTFKEEYEIVSRTIEDFIDSPIMTQLNLLDHQSNCFHYLGSNIGLGDQ